MIHLLYLSPFCCCGPNNTCYSLTCGSTKLVDPNPAAVQKLLKSKALKPPSNGYIWAIWVKNQRELLDKKNSSCCTTHHMCYWHHLVYERTSSTTSHASRATWRENLSEWMKKWIPTAKPREFACYNLTNSMMRDSFPAVSQVHYVHPDWLRWMNKLRRWHIRTTAWLEQAGRPCAFQRSCWP